MASVFAMQGVGSLISVVVVLLCLGLGMSAGFTWRFALAFGAVPAILAFPWRMRMHETETFERVKQDRREAAEAAEAAASNPSLMPAGMTTLGGYGGTEIDKSMPEKFGGFEQLKGSSDLAQDDILAAKAGAEALRNEGLDSGTRWSEVKRAFRYYKYHMVGTALSWFLLDVDFYANGLFNHDVTALILSNGKPTTALDVAWNSAFLCLVGTSPFTPFETCY
jgi:hypothetical protein